MMSSGVLTKKSLDGLLKGHNIGAKLFGSGNMLFDGNYTVAEHSQFVAATEYARDALNFYNYVPERDDCDNYAFMWYGRMLEYFSKNAGGNFSRTFGPCWGYFNGEAHMWGYGLTDMGFNHVNYGHIVVPGSYKGIGSITA